jgi:coatomer protein complex subunit gamma
LALLEQQLTSYLSDPAGKMQPFDFKSVPVMTKASEASERHRISVSSRHLICNVGGKAAMSQFARAAGIVSQPSSPTRTTNSSPIPPAAGSNAYKQAMSAQLEKIPQFASFGPLFKCSKPVALTESDVAEYVVSCVKLTFAEFIVFQVCIQQPITNSSLIAKTPWTMCCWKM